MSSLVFYSYTMLVLAAMFGTACVMLFAYASSGRRFFILLTALFLLYAFEICEIFYLEFLPIDDLYMVEGYYNISIPIPRTLVATCSQVCIQLLAAGLIGRTDRRITIITGVLFFAVSALIVDCMPVGAMQQFCYYSLRQLFIAGTLIYLAWGYKNMEDKALKTRLSTHIKEYVIVCILLAAVLIEDTIVILLLPTSYLPEWSLIYLSERNFSENIFVCYLAYVSLKYAIRLLSIRINTNPKEIKEKGLEEQLDEQLELFTPSHGLSAREAEVLRMVVLGKNNRQIASELYLSEGTVKKHVHNIMVKTDTSTREGLTQVFWRS